MRTAAFIAGTLITIASAAAQQAPTPADPWFNPTRFALRITVPPQRDFSSNRLLKAKNGDMRIDTSGVVQGKSYSGELMVVSGNYMLAKGLELSRGREIDAMDVPALEMQFAMKLLARAFPRGPKSVTTTHKVDIHEAEQPLQIATPSASGEYSAPWSETGSVKRESPTRVSFTLSFNFSGNERPFSITGTWESGSAPDFPDTTPIKEWRAFRLGPIKSEQGGTTTLDFGAQEIPGGFATLGDLRKHATSG